MLVCNARGFLVVRTKFNDKFYLIQKFRGLDKTSNLYNNPIDFMESGLMYKDKPDYWHIDIPFALNTDEAVPAFINGGFIGGNHGCNCAIEVYAPNHGQNIADIGSLWKDNNGVNFTLLKIYNEDYLLFISENKGTSVNDYSFTRKICGQLVSIDDCNVKIIVPQEQKVSDLRRAIRNKKTRVVAFIDGKERQFDGQIECDYVEIHEDYEIVNPATVADELYKARIKKPFTYQPDLADYGIPMLSCNLIYRIIGDGTVFTIFDYKKLTNVKFTRFMGQMFQEKLDVYGGGIWRYFPKILPFKTEEGQFDFSSPYCITDGLFPKDVYLTRENFNDNGSPCERVVDYFRDKEGRDKLAFACGFLPVYDGAPEIRNKRVSNVLHLKNTRKYYPTFVDGDLNCIKGVAYKKYFIPLNDKCSYYDVSFDNKKYLYFDVFNKINLVIPFVGKSEIIEEGGDVNLEITNDTIDLIGEKGYAVIVNKI